MAIEDLYPKFSDEIAAARQEGYSDKEIGRHFKAKVAEAQKEGYSEQEINEYLGRQPEANWVQSTFGAVGSALAGMPAGVATLIKGVRPAYEEGMKKINEGRPVTPAKPKPKWAEAALSAMEAANSPKAPLRRTVEQGLQNVTDFWNPISQDLAPKFAGTFAENPSVKRGVAAFMQGAASMGVAVPVSVFAGPNAGAAILAASEAGGVYEEAMAAGKTPQEAFQLAMKSGSINFILEKAGLDTVIGSKGGPVVRGVKGAVGESGTELTQTVSQNAIAKHNYDPSREYFEGGIEAVIGGLAGGPAAVMAGDGSAPRKDYVSRADRNRQLLKERMEQLILRKQEIDRENAISIEETKRANIAARQQAEQQAQEGSEAVQAPPQPTTTAEAEATLDHSQVEASNSRIPAEIGIMLQDPTAKPSVVMTKEVWEGFTPEQRAEGKKNGLRYVKQGDSYLAYHYDTVKGLLGTRTAKETDAAVRAKAKSGETGDILFGSKALTPEQGEVDTAVTLDGRVLTDPAEIAAENGQGNIATAAKLKADEVATIAGKQAAAVQGDHFVDVNKMVEGDIFDQNDNADLPGVETVTPSSGETVQAGAADLSEAPDRNANGLTPMMVESLRIEASNIDSAYSEKLVIDGYQKNATISENRGASPWYLDNGFSKKETVSALRRAADGKPLNDRQQQIVGAAVDWISDLASTQAKPVMAGDLKVGDKFTGLAPDGQLDDFTVIADNGETKTIKDGVEFEVDAVFDEIPVVGEVQRGRGQQQESTVKPAQRQGEDGKLFATPPTFGHKAKAKGGQNVTELAMETEMAVAADNAKQAGMDFSVHDVSAAETVTRQDIEMTFPGADVVYNASTGKGIITLPNGVRIRFDLNARIVVNEQQAKAASVKYGREIRPGTEAAGSWQIIDNAGVLSLAKWSDRSTLDHEAFHGAMDIVLTEAEKKNLLAKYGNEEAAARAYQKWNPQQKADTIFQKIADFFQKIAEFFNGPYAETTFAKIRSGEVWQRQVDPSGDLAKVVRRVSEGKAKLIQGPESFPEGFLSEESLKAAEKNLLDRINFDLGNNPNVEVKEKIEDIGFFRTMLNTPSRLADRYKKLTFYVQNGKRAVHQQDRMRGIFDKKLIDIIKHVPDKNGQREAFYGLLWEGDAQETTFTLAELQAMQQSDPAITQAVIDSYINLRKFHKQVWRTMKIHRNKYGLETGYREGHIPHLFENWNVHEMIEIVDPNSGESKRVSAGIVPNGTHRSLKEAVEFANKLNPGKDFEIRPKTFQLPGDVLAQTVLKDQSIYRLENEIASVFALTRDEARDFVNQAARKQGKHRLFGNLAQRKGSEGFRRDDLPKILTAYYRGVARYLALDDFKSKVIPKFQRDFGVLHGDAHKLSGDDSQVAAYVEKYINDVLGVPGMVEKLLDNTLQKYFGKFLRSGRPTIWAVNKVLHANSVLKLGLFNIASAGVNMMQTLNTFSKVPAKHFAWALAQAMRPSNAKTKAILRRSGIEFDLGLEDTGGYSMTHAGGKVVKASLFFFSKAEYLNRKVTALAAHRWAKEMGQTDRQAIDFARMMVDLTQFDYSVADTAQVFRNPVGRLLGQFKPYAMKQLGFILGLKGPAEQIKFWVPTLLLGGMMGVPAVEGIGTLYQWTAGRMFGFLFEALGFYKDDEDEEREIGEVSGKAKVANILRGHPVTEAKKYLMEWAEDDPTKKRVAESIMYGMAAHLGVDISRRVGLGDMLPERGSDYAGPSVSSLLQFYTRAQEGWDWTEQLRILAPSVGNIATGIEWALNDGKVYDPYNRQNLKYYATTKDMFFRAAGLRNTVEAKISDTRRVEDAHQRAVQSASHSIVDKYIDAHQKGDRERADQILKDGIEYLQGRFGKGTHITPESVKAALKGRVLPDGLRRVMGAPKVDKPRQGKYNDFIGEAATRLPQERGE